MIKSSVTISLVSEAQNGPFVFHGELDKGLLKAASLGFDAVELFLPSARSVDQAQLRRKLSDNGLTLSALGTGAGFLIHGWTLCSPEKPVRQKALSFISEMVYLGAEFQAPVIIGSMKGSTGREEDREAVSARLIENLAFLAEKAQESDTTILLEPLNRYETNLVNRLEEGVGVLDELGTDRFRLLADLFHMNIEEESIPQALRLAEGYVGYLHFVDSNRKPAGFGHINFEELASVLKEIRYEGYLSAEALPYPNSELAASKTMETFERHIQPINQEEANENGRRQ